ncbi:hypothetical protein [Sinosporangium siamense]|uniref:Lipoprotein n=1 Tax=Sinosporangium siamense TaxID=1367973 RepID=A0A919V7A8_9ACTN|nr:hypothetical protein [Sinosporangium siamense]GII91892.1 lipoprotein [Sinosporangium siamense]
MRFRRTACSLALVATACGCGIQPTGVVDAGEHPWGAASGTRLYFVSAGRLSTAGRPGRGVGPAEAVKLVLRGPSRAERERGLTGAVPAGVTVKVAAEGESVTLTPDRALSRLAEGQLVCTAAEAQAAGRGVPLSSVKVTVVAGTPTGCDAYLR